MQYGAMAVLAMTVKTPSTTLPAQRQNPLLGFVPQFFLAGAKHLFCVLAQLRLCYGGWVGPPSGGPGWLGLVVRTLLSPPP